MNILVIRVLIQLVLPPHHSDGRLKEPISLYTLLRCGILRDMIELLIALNIQDMFFIFFYFKNFL